MLNYSVCIFVVQAQKKGAVKKVPHYKINIIVLLKIPMQNRNNYLLCMGINFTLLGNLSFFYSPFFGAHGGRAFHYGIGSISAASKLPR